MTDSIIIDLSTYKDRTGATVPAGRYTVIVDDAEVATSKSGNQMVNIWLRIVGGDYDGQMLLDRLVLTEKSMFRVVNFLQAVNVPTPRKRLQINLRQLLRRSLFVDVEDGEPYMGRVKSEVRGYAPLPRSQQTADAPDFDESAVSEQPEPVQPAAPAAPAAAAPQTVDEVLSAIASTNGGSSADAVAPVDLDTLDL